MEPDAQWQPKVIDLSPVEGAFSFEEGLSRPDWRTISKAIQQTDPLDRGIAWDEAARQWVMQLQKDLGGDYRVEESHRFILLTELNRDGSGKVLDFSEHTMERIRERLGEAAWRPDYGKHVILLFTEDDDYYQYVSYFHRDGTHPTSGGCLIHKDYVHIAAPYEPLGLREMLAHEFTHNCLVHLPLPLWLNEGLATMFQRAASRTREPVLDFELREMHLAFWNPENIQEFWAGVSFHKPGDSNKLSYSLAEIVVNLLGEQQRDWSAFIKQAHRVDAGQTAAIECLGINLETVISTFLGEEDWRPRRKAMITLWASDRK